MKLDNIKKLIAEDFDKKDQDFVSRLSAILNPFMDQLYSILNNRVDFDNLYQEIITFKTMVDANGFPLQTTKFSTQKLPFVKGSYVISVRNITDSLYYPNSSPFVAFTPNNDKTYNVEKVTGLLPNKSYEIILVLIGK